MGLDLTLLPFGNTDTEDSFSNQVLRLTRNDELFERVQKLPALPVPKTFESHMGYGEDGDRAYRNTQKTSYGKPLLATTMGYLKTCNIPGPCGAFVAASPDDQRVALYWH